MSQSLDKVVFQGSADVDFDYMVNGIRAGYEDRQSDPAESAISCLAAPRDRRLGAASGRRPSAASRPATS